jgi:DNA replication ATP-dependent helicase Dna2
LDGRRLMDIPDLQDFLQRERQAAREEASLAAVLADAALVDRGDALLGLQIVQRGRNSVVFRCDENESLFRAGTQLDLACGRQSLRGVIVELTDRGHLLEVRVERKTASLPDGPWTAIEASIDTSFVVSQCLAKLQPGAPGWSFFNVVAGNSAVGPLANHPLEAETLRVLDEVVASAGGTIDSSQQEVLEQSARLPNLYAVQGPPGTGKTMLLALVAESLVRLGRRVLIVAPTHQAVNNALSAIRRLFPDTPLVKIGDELRRESLAESIPCRPAKDATAGVSAADRSRLVVGMTFLSALHNQGIRASGLSPNALLIDEAGQLPLTQGACAGLLGAGVNILFGDDAQLPPVFAGDLAEDRLAVSLFRQFRRTAPERITRLSTTYRMNAALCDIVAREFYTDGAPKLQPSPDVAGSFFALPRGEPTLESMRRVLDPTEGFVWLQTPGQDCLQSNPWEAEAVASVIATCLAHGKTAREIAVVTPFRRQAALIRRTLQGLVSPDAELPIIDTVERVQGLTVDLVAISMAASDPEFIASVAGFLLSPNRLNVAISRARTKAVIAASPALLDVVPGEYSAFLGRESMGRVLSQSRSSLAFTADH